MTKIFLNFQGADGGNAADLFALCLSSEFGHAEVFRSSESIEWGSDFRPALLNGVRNCRVMLVLIGSRWNVKALHEPGNWVHREIAMALELKKLVIPVLFEKDATMPAAADLPEDIRDLVSLQNVKTNYRDSHVWRKVLPGMLLDLVPELGIGVVPGLVDLATWWQDQARLTGLPGSLPLVGRDDAVEAVESWLDGPPTVQVLRGASREDVVMFMAALIATRRAVLASTQDGWRHALRLLPLLIVASCSDVDVEQATRAGHHVLVPSDPIDDDRHVHATLRRIPRDGARDLLIAHGMSYAEAHACSGVARRSVRALTRRLAPGQATPPWAAVPLSPLAVPLMLAGAWQGDADQAVLERLTSTTYEEVERFARSSVGSNDPFLHRSGTRWQLADVQDAWALLRGHLTTADVDRWSGLAFEVLFSVDTSTHLRRGVFQGIAVAGTSGDARAERLVVDLLRHANDDPSGQRWVVLADSLPLLAEAAPESFLDGVFAGLSGKDPVLAHLFTSARPGHSAHTYLLWALGRLCWSAEHLLLGVRALGRLAELDPDPASNYRNRPEELLWDVLLPVMPFTTAPAELQRTAISDVCRRHPDVGWRLVVRFLSGEFGVHALTDRPEFRDWPAGLVSAPQEDSGPTFEHLLGLAMDELSARPDRWSDVIPGLARTPVLVDALTAVDVDTLTPDVRLRLWWQLLDHLKYHDEPRLDEFVNRVEPVDLPERHARLFTSSAVPLRALDDLAAYDEEVRVRRVAAVEETVGGHGLAGLVRLASEAQSPWFVGRVAANVVGFDRFDEVLPLMKGNDAAADLASGWLDGIAQEQADAVLPVVSARLTSWDASTQGRVLLALPRTAEVLDLVEAAHPLAQGRYWQLVPAAPAPGNEDRLLRELVDHERTEAVVDTLAFAVLSKRWTPPNDLVVFALTSAAREPRRVSGQRAYDVGTLLSHLLASGADLDLVADLELAHFSAVHHHRQPVALYQGLSEDPKKFVRLVELALDRSRTVRAEAWLALFKCRTLPVSREWVDEALALLADTDHLDAGGVFIGHLLAGSPTGSDGAWPSEFVRDVLDDLMSSTVREGFVIGTLNNRPFSIRGAYEGGAQERAVGAEYEEWARQVGGRWPYTARALRMCAEGFAGQASHWDGRADEDHDA